MAILLTALFFCLCAIPNFFPEQTVKRWPTWAQRHIVLGLDLQGGSHLLLQVNRDSIVAERIKSLRRDVRSALANDNGIGNLITTGTDSITVELTDPTQKDAAMAAVQKLQTNVSSGFGVGGVPELAFSETPDGKMSTVPPAGTVVKVKVRVPRSASAPSVRRRRTVPPVRSATV